MSWNKLLNNMIADIRRQEVEVNVQSVWDAIEPEVDNINKKKRKRRFLPYFLFGIGNCILIVGFILFDATKPNNQHVKSEQFNTINDLQESDAKAYVRTESYLNPSDSIVSFSRREISDLDRDLLTKESNVSSAHEPELKASERKKRLRSRSTLSSGFTDQVKQVGVLHNTEGPVNYTDFKIPLEEQGKSKTTLNGQEQWIGIHEKGVNSAIKLKNDGLIIDDQKGVKYQSVGSLNLALQDFSYTHVLEPLTIHELSEFLLHLSPPNAVRGIKSNNAIHDKKNILGPRFGLTFQGGIGYSDRSFSSSSQQDGQLLVSRNSTETPLETTHLGTALVYRYNKNLELTLGLRYTNITERFDYVNIQDSYLTEHGTLFYRINADGEQEPVEGSLVVTERTYINKRIYNRYGLLDIPLTLVFFLSRDQWKAGLKAGLAFNISLDASGQFLNRENNVVDINRPSANTPGFYSSNIGWSYLFGLSLGYELNDRWSLRFDPQILWYSDSFTHADWSLNQRYITFSGQAGLIYWLR